MRRQFQRLALAISLLILTAFVLFVINQTVQVVALASSLNPILGKVVLVALLVVYACLVFIPIVLFVRLPRSLRPPAGADSAEYAAYLGKLRRRLERSPELANYHAPCTDDKTWVEGALRVLDGKANVVVKSAASAVFLSTAISQNGRLDAFMVLAAQSRMVWQVAHIYNQRPSLGEVVRLYADVAVATSASSQIEELDLGEQAEVVLGPIIGSSFVSAVPGLGVVAGFLVDALVEGGANAFMALRAGMIAKQYCSSLTTVQGSAVRRSAATEAAGLLGSIMLECGAAVSQAVWKAASKAASGTLSRSAEGTRKTMTRASEGLSQAAEKMSQGVLAPIERARRVVTRVSYTKETDETTPAP